MCAYFGDILEDHDKRMDFEVEEPFKMDAIKLLTFKAKSKPAKHIALSQGVDMVRGKTAGDFDFKHKSELTKTNKDGSGSTKFTASNKDFAVDREWAPEDLNKDGMHSTIELEGKWTPAKSDWEGKLEWKIGGMKMGPIVPWTELQVDTNKAKDHTVTYSQNLVYENNFHCAWKLVGGAKEKKLTEAYGLLAWNTSEMGDLYFRSNCLKNIVALGWGHKCTPDLTSNVELQWDMKKANVGLMGHPFFFRAGFAMNLNSNKTKLTSMLNFGDKWWVTEKYEMAMTDNIKLTTTVRTDIKAAVTKPEAATVSAGFAMEFKM